MHFEEWRAPHEADVTAILLGRSNKTGLSKLFIGSVVALHGGPQRSTHPGVLSSYRVQSNPSSVVLRVMFSGG